MLNDLFQPISLLLVFLLSAGLNLFFIRSRWLNTRLAPNEEETHATQAMHERPTLRIGGVGVVTSFAMGVCMLNSASTAAITLAILAGSIIFVTGLLEDIFRNITPRVRMFAALGSAALAMALTGIVVPRLGIPPVDPLFGLTFFGIAITLLWSAGACNAINLIDGLNGLSSGYTIAATIGLIAVALKADVPAVASAALLLIPSVLGFLSFNWPRGLIFLGDAGAYTIGHILAWLCIILLASSSEVAPFALLLILFWPVADMLTALMRRRLTKAAAGQPDDQHSHHLMLRLIKKTLGKNMSITLRNSLASFCLIPFYIMPICLGVILWNEPLASVWVLLSWAVLFLLSYAGLSRYLTKS